PTAARLPAARRAGCRWPASAGDRPAHQRAGRARCWSRRSPAGSWLHLRIGHVNPRPARLERNGVVDLARILKYHQVVPAVLVVQPPPDGAVTVVVRVAGQIDGHQTASAIPERAHRASVATILRLPSVVCRNATPANSPAVHEP